MGILSMDMSLILKNTSMEERHTNNGVCIKGSTSSEFEVDYYGRLEEVIELQYHSEQNIVFFIQMLLV